MARVVILSNVPVLRELMAMLTSQARPTTATRLLLHPDDVEPQVPELVAILGNTGPEIVVLLLLPFHVDLAST
nr:hypothetical protein CFP56_03659 [Quercus suber]